MCASVGGASLVLHADDVSHLTSTSVVPTLDAAKFEWHSEHRTRIVALFGVDGFADEIKCSDGDDCEFGLLLESTSFYAEAGGQVSDSGNIVIGDAV